MISIIMPVYNGIEYIHESVGSVIDQTYTEWELLIGVNGHPKDSAVCSIAQEYEKKNDKIRVLDLYFLHGKVVALHALLPHCRHSYVALLDVDDVWLPTKLEQQAPFMGMFDVIGTRCSYFGELDNPLGPDIPMGDLRDVNFRERNPVINSSALVRTELCAWNDNCEGVEDYDLWLRLWRQGRTFYNLPDRLVRHRIHSQSAFNSKGNSQMVAQLPSFQP